MSLSGGGLIRQVMGPVQRAAEEKRALLRAFLRLIAVGKFFFVQRLGWDPIAFVQPAAKINVGAAARTKGPILGIGIFGTDGAGHVKSSLKGRRSRLRVNSKSPSVVQPARLVSAASDLNAARMT